MDDFSKPHNCSDVALIFGDEVIHTSRYLLCSHSETLRNMLTSDAVKESEFVMPADDSYDGFIIIIKYLLNKPLNFTNRNIIPACLMAHKYEFYELEKICQKFDMKFADIDHCLDVYIQTQAIENMFQLSWLAKHCELYIPDNLTPDNIINILNKLIDVNNKYYLTITGFHYEKLLPIMGHAENITDLTWFAVSRIGNWNLLLLVFDRWSDNNQNREYIVSVLNTLKFEDIYRNLSPNIISRLTNIIKKIPDIIEQNSFYEYVIDYYEARERAAKKIKVDETKSSSVFVLGQIK